MEIQSSWLDTSALTFWIIISMQMFMRKLVSCLLSRTDDVVCALMIYIEGMVRVRGCGEPNALQCVVYIHVRMNGKLQRQTG